jgi:hypothetical protein
VAQVYLLLLRHWIASTSRTVQWLSARDFCAIQVLELM